MTKLLATSVVRGSEQGQSHGGLFLIDLETQQIEQKLPNKPATSENTVMQSTIEQARIRRDKKKS